ncbi:MAG TPA: phage/plasmid primase, P4 family [Blastocatellia bacterium]|nr:phage/plasmid primase, P4 family [Blastocatellia bacterium]
MNGNGHNASAEEILATAQRYIDAGLSIIPIKTNGSKRPAADLLPKVFDPEKQREKATWKPFQSRYATDEELRRWSRKGIAIVCGKISGFLEVIDNDSLSVWPQWCDLVKQHKPGLLERLVIVQTPSGCFHVLYRCDRVEGNQPLARRLVVVPKGTKGAKLYKGSAEQFKGKYVVVDILFETRGEGGYIVAPGSPLSVHPTGQPYRFIQGDVSDIPTITPDERELLLVLAASFDEMPKEPDKPKKTRQQTELSPGDDYNLRGDPAAVLTRHGWTLTQRVGAVEYYKRPGKGENGHSASLHAIGHNNFYCFSTAAAPFDAERKYDAFGVYSRLEHGGDDTAAAKQLAKEGYGSQQPTANNSNKTKADDSTKTKAPTHDVLRNRWIKSQPPTVYAMSSFMQYRKGLWKPKEEGVIKGQMQRIIEKAKAEGIRPTGGLLSSVYALAVAFCSVSSERFNAQHQYLVCANGTLNLETRQLEPHNPNHYCTSGVDYDYDPDATSPTWMAFLDWLCEAANNQAPPYRKNDAGRELIEYLQEYSGLALTTDNSHELALWLHGPPGCGKSTFIEGIMAAMGDRTIEIGLGNIERSRFAIGDLPGKTLAIATEQPGDFVRSTDLLIKLISGELVTVEKKFAHPYSFRSTVKILWAMNDLPRIGSPGSGLFRRVKVIKWPKLDPADVKESVKEQIKKEGPGILNWALDGLYRLRQLGHFYTPDEVQQASIEFRESNDIPAAFIAECCDVDISGKSDLKVAAGDLYKAYKEWAIATGHKPKSIQAIAEDWKRLGFWRTESGGYPYWNGLSLRPISITL